MRFFAAVRFTGRFFAADRFTGRFFAADFFAGRFFAADFFAGRDPVTKERKVVHLELVSESGDTFTIRTEHIAGDLDGTSTTRVFRPGASPNQLVSDDGRHVVIRPLAYVEEPDLEAYAQLRQFPIIPCDLCGSQEQLQRKQVKAMLREWEKKQPGRLESIFGALTNVAPSHLLDRSLFDFAAVQATGEAAPVPVKVMKRR